MSASAERIAQGRAAFLWACGLDVAVRKPGNVSVFSAGHAMEAAQFLASARASVAPLFAPGAPVGERIEGAVRATRAAVGCNTNLGILLLCAPLAVALERGPATHPQALREACAAVLEGLDVADARAAYRAIAHANPGGLGRAEAQDVASEPTIGLREAMGLAAERDSIARQYAAGYADVLGAGLAALAAPAADLATAVQRVFLTYLARWPDSHTVRKLGVAVAQTVTEEAASQLARLDGGLGGEAKGALAEWDERLKNQGINPGTSADLTVCTLFAWALLRPESMEVPADASWHGM